MRPICDAAFEYPRTSALILDKPSISWSIPIVEAALVVDFSQGLDDNPLRLRTRLVPIGYSWQENLIFPYFPIPDSLYSYSVFPIVCFYLP